MVVQPFNTEVGAGTLNPATIAAGARARAVAGRVRRAERPARRRPLRREPEPAADAHPVPGDPQAGPGQPAGAVPRQPRGARASTSTRHDVRFVEDNWANPAIGAWGLGWEVWLDGLEITQFTYFQQAGGMTLDPVSVEITYGIERIMMALQGVSHFKDIAYAPGISYGEAFGQAEYEMSRYYLDDADVERQKRPLRGVRERGPPDDRRAPPGPRAHLRAAAAPTRSTCSTPAAPSVRRSGPRRSPGCGTLAREVAQLWAERRTELEHPLGIAELPAAGAAADRVPAIGRDPTAAVRDRHRGDAAVGGHQDRRGGAAALTEKLAATRLGHGDITTYAHAAPGRRVRRERRPASRTPSGWCAARGSRPRTTPTATSTKAAAGFARGQGSTSPSCTTWTSTASSTSR